MPPMYKCFFLEGWHHETRNNKNKETMQMNIAVFQLVLLCVFTKFWLGDFITRPESIKQLFKNQSQAVWTEPIFTLYVSLWAFQDKHQNTGTVWDKSPISNCYAKMSFTIEIALSILASVFRPGVNFPLKLLELGPSWNCYTSISEPTQVVLSVFGFRLDSVLIGAAIN